MLGGPQAGIIGGKKDLVRQIRRNPLFRAIRVDKLTYAILETTLNAYLQDQPDRIPTLRMIRMTTSEVDERARRLLEACAHPENGRLQMELVDGESVIGGGSAPGQTLPTRLLAIKHVRHSAANLGKWLLVHRPPVVARVESDRVLLDLRTVLPEQEPALKAALLSLIVE